MEAWDIADDHIKNAKEGKEMSNKPDFEVKLRPDKMLREFEAKRGLTDIDMQVYFVILAQAKEPAEIWMMIPDQLKAGLLQLVPEAMKMGEDKKPIVGGPFEAYWTHSAIERWYKFFQQNELIHDV